MVDRLIQDHRELLIIDINSLLACDDWEKALPKLKELKKDINTYLKLVKNK